MYVYIYIYIYIYRCRGIYIDIYIYIVDVDMYVCTLKKELKMSAQDVHVDRGGAFPFRFLLLQRRLKVGRS